MRNLLYTLYLIVLAAMVSCGEDKPAVQIDFPYDSLFAAQEVAAAAELPLMIDFYRDT